jgi:hypothetical protein
MSSDDRPAGGRPGWRSCLAGLAGTVLAWAAGILAILMVLSGCVCWFDGEAILKWLGAPEWAWWAYYGAVALVALLMILAGAGARMNYQGRVSGYRPNRERPPKRE